MLADALPYLRCPHCGGGLTLADGTLVCAARHSFDVARQGYVSLFAGDVRHPGDTPDMVAARERFLGAGHFEPLANAVAEAARAAWIERAEQQGRQTAGAPPATKVGAGLPAVVDIGSGPGYYLARVLDALDLPLTGLALDSSKHALRRAARAHAAIGAVGCDIWRGLPLGDGVAALMLNVFAPRNGAEIRRVLRPGGTLIVATPTPRHLGELVEAAGLLHVDERKQERLDDKLAPHLELVDQRPLEWTLRLEEADLVDAVSMGPSSFHRPTVPPAPLDVAASVTLSTYQR
jgi:23S rRNA (guanine745-N1)-methyltransferase